MVYVNELSPHQLGIPQQRERVIFSCIRKDIWLNSHEDNTEETMSELFGTELDLGLTDTSINMKKLLIQRKWIK